MRKALLFCSLIISCEAFSQITLVKDFYPGPACGNPSRITPFNGKLTMVASNGTDPGSGKGYEFYAMDGVTSQFTHYDVNPGAADGCYPWEENYTPNTVAAGKLYFPASNGAAGFELFSYDGVNAPALAADVRTGPMGSDIREMITIGNNVYFSATTPTAGRELWMYNTTTNTAQLVTDLWPGATDSYPQSFTSFNGKLYFQARNSTEGYELFVCDPATNTVSLVTDIYPGVMDSRPSDFITVGDILYFIARDANHGVELYSMDTTTAITRLTDINAGAAHSLYGSFARKNAIGALNGRLYFSVRDNNVGQKLYSYDIATATASMVMQMNTAPSSSLGNEGSSFINFGNKLYFSADDGTHGLELWSLDGTSAPSMVMDLYPGHIGSEPKNMAVFNNALYISAISTAHCEELFRFTGVAAPTGVETTVSEAAITLFPNPASGRITISGPKSATATGVVIMDLTGKEALRIDAAAGRQTFDISTLIPGVYIARVIDQDGSEVRSRLAVR